MWIWSQLLKKYLMKNFIFCKDGNLGSYWIKFEFYKNQFISLRNYYFLENGGDSGATLQTISYLLS